jgi:glycosyltransferase involved in cell wall biosynthesis
MLETDGPGGAEVVLFQLCGELRDRGHSVYPISPVRGERWLSGRFKEHGFEHQEFVIRRPLDWRCLRNLAHTLRRLRIDVVHSHEFTMAVYGAAACKLVGCAHVITMHGSQSMTRALRRRIALRWAFRSSSVTTAVSTATKTQLDHDLGLGPQVISVIHNGVVVKSGDHERVRRELGMRPGELLILAVGNLDPRKGHMVLLEALAEIARRRPGSAWRLAIAGGRGGPERPRLEAFAAREGLADRVHILDYRDDVPDLLAAADIFAMPSLWEGLPLAILEAMLAGAAIVASETSGIPEAIVSGEHGLLTPPGDVGALAGALEQLIGDAAFRRRLGEAGRRRAQAEFTIGAMTDSYEALYRAATTTINENT